MEGICENFLNQVQFFRLLKGRCHSNQFYVVSKTQICTIFAIFIPYERFLSVDDRFDFFFNISRDVAMATNFVSYQTCLLRAEVFQDPLDRSSQFLHRMVGIELQIINTIFLFRCLKGHCHGNQLESKRPFITDQSNLSCCHSERDYNITILISTDYIE